MGLDPDVWGRRRRRLLEVKWPCTSLRRGWGAGGGVGEVGVGLQAEATAEVGVGAGMQIGRAHV